MIVGDESFGWNWPRIATRTDVLDSLRFLGGSALARLRRHVDPSTFETLTAGADSRVAVMGQDSPDLQDVMDSIFFEQKVGNVLMPWRERFTAEAGPVTNPLLDADILDFVRRLPSPLRRGKRLYRHAIRRSRAAALRHPVCDWWEPRSKLAGRDRQARGGPEATRDSSDKSSR